jgi:hypothetical protein
MILNSKLLIKREKIKVKKIIKKDCKKGKGVKRKSAPMGI